MTVNDTGNALFAISGKASTGVGSTEYRNRIYVYKYFYRNQGGVELSVLSPAGVISS